MTLTLGPGWSVDLDRGPDWLFVRLHGPPGFDSESIDLAERVWCFLEQHMAHRLVVELDDVGLLRSHLIGELVRLQKRVCSSDRVMRICGLSDSNYAVLQSSRLHLSFPRYDTREQAVMGHRPAQPR